jgi:phosphatidylinositol glycan class B
VLVPLALSLISHKEVRFIYPLLPCLHVLAGTPLTRFFGPAISSSSSRYIPRRLTLIFLLLVNVVVGYYLSLSHAAGPQAVLRYLREQHSLLPGTSPATEMASHSATHSALSAEANPKMTVGFLMPCHSTPWRSHLVFPNIDAWALSCEPPVNLNATQKATYLDEADQFYNDPTFFLRQNMIGGTRHIPGRPSYQTSRVSNNPLHTPTTHHPIYSNAYYPDQTSTKHNWPDYLVFFAQLESLLQTELRSSSYAECYRTWNTAWHDDWRRKGDIIVWCLDPSSQRDWQRKKYQASARSASRKDVPLQRQELFEMVIDRVKREAGLVGEREVVTKLSWPKWPWRHSQPSSTSRSWPFWKHSSKPAHISWLEDNIYFRSPRGGSWSWSWPWEPKKKSWFARMAASFTNSWHNLLATERSADGPDNEARKLWS